MAAEFVCTVGDASQLDEVFSGPFLRGRREPRIAMVGRSNVGKSSLINSLLGTRLAQVSNQPGKTRAIHFYLWKEAGKIIADLPGYGYAKAGHEERERWSRFVTAYLEHDENLDLALVLLDARHGPTEIDEQAIAFLRTSGIPIAFVFTKSDQLKTQSERAKRKKEVEGVLKELRFDPRAAYWVSSKTRDGIELLAKGLQSEGE